MYVCKAFNDGCAILQFPLYVSHAQTRNGTALHASFVAAARHPGINNFILVLCE
jgi:hypothetical protein